MQERDADSRQAAMHYGKTVRQPDDRLLGLKIEKRGFELSQQSFPYCISGILCYLELKSIRKKQIRNNQIREEIRTIINNQ